MPGTTAITFDDTELSAHMMNHVRDLNNMRSRPYKLVDDIMSNAESLSGSHRFTVRFDVDEHSRFTRVQSGHEIFDNWAQPTLKPGYQTWGCVVLPIFISRIDKEENQGGVIDLLKSRTSTVVDHFRRSFQQVAVRGPAASGTWAGIAGWDDFLSLNGGDTTTGILEDQADGTNTLHAVAKASYPLATHPQFHNYFADVAGAFATNGLNALYDSTIRAQINEGDPVPSESKWYWSENFARLAKRSLRSLEHYNSDGNMDDGARVAHMVYGGIPVRLVPEMPNAGSASTTNPWSAMRVNWKKGVRFRHKKGYALDFDKFVELPGSVGTEYALGWLWGQFVGLRPGTCAVIVDGEA
jgi:hypothetical protein